MAEAKHVHWVLTDAWAVLWSHKMSVENSATGNVNGMNDCEEEEERERVPFLTSAKYMLVFEYSHVLRVELTGQD